MVFCIFPQLCTIFVHFPQKLSRVLTKTQKKHRFCAIFPVAVQIEDIPKHSLYSIVHYLWGVGWRTCIKPHWWFFATLPLYSETLSEVLVNQATGQGKWWGNLLKHQHWRLLWNMWISFQIEAIKWVLLLFDLPSAKVREHIHVLHVEGCIPSPFDLDSWRGHTMRTPKHGCMYVQTTDFAHFLEIILPHGFLHFSTTVHNLCPFPTEVITGFWPKLINSIGSVLFFQLPFK